jgi:CubicO group peptidase (beta-lactamase class C family)
MKFKVLLFFVCATITYSCTGQEKLSPLAKPRQLRDGIKTASVLDAGMDTAVMKQLYTDLASDTFPNIHSVLIYKNDRLVFEQYFRGKDERWGDNLGVIEHKQEDLHDMRSISKSIVSACVGIAISQGKIKNAEQRVFDFLPKYASYDTGSKKNLTIAHLLTMTSGLDWNEDLPYTDPKNSEIQMNNSTDPIAFVLSRPLVSQPGKKWKYNGGTTELLAAIIEAVTGKKVDEYARTYLFKPLGISNFEWIKTPGTARPAAASGLRLKSRDLLKFAILYHQKGKWDNKQILPEQWVKESLQTHVQRPGGDGGYGYQFWTFTGEIQNKTITVPAAVGNGDQRIFIDDNNKLLVVITAGNYNLWNIAKGSFGILRKIYEGFKVQ